MTLLYFLSFCIYFFKQEYLFFHLIIPICLLFVLFFLLSSIVFSLLKSAFSSFRFIFHFFMFDMFFIKHHIFPLHFSFSPSKLQPIYLIHYLRFHVKQELKPFSIGNNSFKRACFLPVSFCYNSFFKENYSILYCFFLKPLYSLFFDNFTFSV